MNNIGCFLAFIFGILIGSFLNVCIYRVPENEDIVFTPSHCSTCDEKIKWYDLVPIISYVLLKGRCRNCNEKVSIQYPVIELLNGVAYMGLFWYFGLEVEFFIGAVLFSTLLVMSIIDFRHMIIPNGLNYFLLVVALFHLVYDREHIVDYIIGGVIVSGILYSITLVTKGKMGLGDVKLMAVSGLLLGWKNIVLSLFIGSVVGSVIGIFLILIGKIKRKQPIPFGPFLGLGIMISYVFGDYIIAWYLSIIV